MREQHSWRERWLSGRLARPLPPVLRFAADVLGAGVGTILERADSSCTGSATGFEDAVEICQTKGEGLSRASDSSAVIPASCWAAAAP